MAADPEGDALLADARALLPVGALEVRAHEAVLSSSNDARRLMEETEAIRVLEGGGGHYLGTMAGPVTGPAGAAFVPGRAGFSIPPLGDHRARARPQPGSPSRAVRRGGRTRTRRSPTRTDRRGPGATTSRAASWCVRRRRT